jgi:hypothetical protein
MTDKEYKEFLAYKSRLAKRDVGMDEHDYGLLEYADKLMFNPGEAGEFDKDASSMHLPDTYKKPNHPTFSTQSKYHIPVIQHGGEWSKDEKFTPSELNLKNMSSGQMQDYFNEVEHPEALELPVNERFSKLKKKLVKPLP